VGHDYTSEGSTFIKKPLPSGSIFEDRVAKLENYYRTARLQAGGVEKSPAGHRAVRFGRQLQRPNAAPAATQC